MQIGNYTPKPSNTGTTWIPTGRTIYNIEVSDANPAVTVFGIDTEGGCRAKTNLLRKPIELVIHLADGAVVFSSQLLCAPKIDGNTATYSFAPGQSGLNLEWCIGLSDECLMMSVSIHASARLGVNHDDIIQTKVFDNIAIFMPFSPRAAGTNILSANWGEKGYVRSPLMINAPDMGQLALAGDGGDAIECRFVGSRAMKETDLYIDIAREDCEILERTIWFRPVHLEKPNDLIPEDEWLRARRGLLSLLQCTAYYPMACGKAGSPGGIIGNNVISDPVSCLLYYNLRWLAGMGDKTVAGGVDLQAINRYSIEYWLNNHINADGAMDYCVESHGNIIADGGTGVLIAAGDYFNSTGDTDFVRRNRDAIIRAANYYVNRDFCGDGLFISHRDGNPNRKFGDTAIDTISSGHKNAYVNAEVYKALSDVAHMLEAVGEDELPAFYRSRSVKLRQSFNRQFYDGETGLYYWWIGKNGVKHQYFYTLLQFYAVIYGIADFLEQDAGVAANGQTLMRALWQEMCRAEYFDSEKQKTVRLIDAENKNYSNLYWGIPICLKPVPPDYNYASFGEKEFPYYCNGCSLPQTVAFAIESFRAAGMVDEAEIIKAQIYRRQHEGLFENGSGFYMGVANEMGKGYSIAKWDGTPTDYEGIISRDCSFLQNTLWYDEKAYRRLTNVVTACGD